MAGMLKDRNKVNVLIGWNQKLKIIEVKDGIIYRGNKIRYASYVWSICGLVIASVKVILEQLILNQI